MTCQELCEFLMQYLEGELKEPERASFAEHVEVCPPCLAYLQTYRKTIELGRSIWQLAQPAQSPFRSWAAWHLRPPRTQSHVHLIYICHHNRSA